MTDKKTCFIISQIGKPDSEERKWADFVRDNIIKPSMKESGYTEPLRADAPDTELLMTDIIEQMFKADLIVADLTNFNPNVFYELGIRHCATNKPVIHLIKDDQKPPFDLAGNKVIFISRDYEKVVEAISEIQERVKSVEKEPGKFYSQVQVYMQLNELDQLKESHGGLERDIYDSLKLLTRLCQSNANILKELDDFLMLHKRVNVETERPTRPTRPTLTLDNWVKESDT